jgi:hypothetical protein
MGGLLQEGTKGTWIGNYHGDQFALLLLLGFGTSNMGIQ